MHPFDIFAAAVALVSIIIGIKRGFISELFRLLAVTGGFIGALLLYKSVYPYLGFIHAAHSLKVAAAFILTYIALAVTLIAIGWLVKKIVHLSMMGWVDRLLGGGLGCLKTVLMLWVIVLGIATCLPLDQQKNIASSRTYSVLHSVPLKLQIPKEGLRLPSTDQLLHPKPIQSLKSGVQAVRDTLDSLKNKFKPFSPPGQP